jgi:ribosomal protein L23
MFGVDVVKVNISNVYGKIMIFKGMVGKRSSYKKDLLKIKSGQSINFEGLN